MIYTQFTFDSTQDISRHPVIIEARKRHYAMERYLDDMRKTTKKLIDDGYPSLANQYQACLLTIFSAAFL